MRTEILEDGTIRHLHSPMKDVPFFSRWLEVLEERGLAAREADGRIRPFVRGHLQPAFVADNSQVMIRCVCCGGGFPQLEMAKITIGGLIQMPREIAVEPKLIDVRWRIQPVHHAGLGCKACQERMREAEAAAALGNRMREAYATALASVLAGHNISVAVMPPTASQAKCLHGIYRADCCAICCRGRKAIGPQTVALPTTRTPFIDVLGNFNGAAR